MTITEAFEWMTDHQAYLYFRRSAAVDGTVLRLQYRYHNKWYGIEQVYSRREANLHLFPGMVEIHTILDMVEAAEHHRTKGVGDAQAG